MLQRIDLEISVLNVLIVGSHVGQIRGSMSLVDYGDANCCVADSASPSPRRIHGLKCPRIVDSTDVR